MDELLIRKAQKGDKESFTKAVLELKDQAYRIAYCYLHDEEDGMDAVCDAVEKALVNIKKLKDPKFFKTWFIRIVINECKMQMRKKKRVISLADSMAEDIAVASSDREGRLDLENLLRTLEPSERNMIYMKYYMGYTLAEIAEIVELPEGTVKTRIYGCLRNMRGKLEVREVL